MESYGGSLKYFKVYLRSREQYIQINKTEKKTEFSLVLLLLLLYVNCLRYSSDLLEPLFAYDTNLFCFKF